MSRFKKPRPAQGKHIKSTEAAPEGSTQDLSPVFCLKHLRGKYCLSSCEMAEKASFADTLHKLCKLKWSDIQRSHRHGVGCETIDRKQISQQLPSEATDDVALLAFRFEGKKAMVGFRKNRIFHILFLDRDFTLYNHG
jgi:hypothetical protein